MPRISNREVRSYVDRREEFVTNNGTIISDTTFSGDIDDATALPADKGKGFYIVYSYGKHFPMFAYDETAAQWFGNGSKYSHTTTRHQSHARPSTDDILWLDHDGMLDLLWEGSYAAYCAARILKKAS